MAITLHTCHASDGGELQAAVRASQEFLHSASSAWSIQLGCQHARIAIRCAGASLSGRTAKSFCQQRKCAQHLSSVIARGSWQTAVPAEGL